MSIASSHGRPDPPLWHNGERHMFYLEWSKHPRNPVIARPPDGIQATGFRDPQVWREGAEWLMA